MNPERRLSFKADNAGGFDEIVPEKMSEGFIERELSTTISTGDKAKDSLKGHAGTDC